MYLGLLITTFTPWSKISTIPEDKSLIFSTSSLLTSIGWVIIYFTNPITLYWYYVAHDCDHSIVYNMLYDQKQQNG